VSCHKCHLVMSHDKSHDGCGKVVHRPCSNCISSVQEITLLSSSCQQGGCLSYLRLSHYIVTLCSQVYCYVAR